MQTNSLLFRYLYWIEYEEHSAENPAPPRPTIWRCRLDGTNVTRFITNYLNKPSGIALSFREERCGAWFSVPSARVFSDLQCMYHRMSCPLFHAANLPFTSA